MSTMAKMNTGNSSDLSGRDLLALLDKKIESDTQIFLTSNVWKTISSPASSTQSIVALLREVYWEIHCYQPHTTKAGFSMIGGIDAHDMKIMKTLLLHKWDEVEHRIWAWDCYVALGGDTTRDSSKEMSPGAFAVSAVWERLANTIHPLAYIGAEYLFEALTAQLTPLVMNAVKERNIDLQGLRFIADHAVEDQKHRNLFEHLIVEIGDKHPEIFDQIIFSYDCFNVVYPMALWNASLERSLS